MSQAPPPREAPPAPMPLATLLQSLDALGVTFRQEGERLALKPPQALTAELQRAVIEHKPELLALCALRADFGKLHTQITFLRCQERTAKAARPALLEFLARQIKALAARCDLADGYADPTDPFADVALSALRAAFDELTAEGNPYPLGPLGDDPFSEGRCFDGTPLMLDSPPQGE